MEVLQKYSLRNIIIFFFGGIYISILNEKIGIDENIILPKKDSPLYKLIYAQARGRWQKNKAHDLLTRGYTLNDIGLKNKNAGRSIQDYKQSLQALVNRINNNLIEENAIYEVKFKDEFYYLTRR